MHAPPLLVSFANVETYVNACNLFEDRTEEADILKLAASNLPPVASKATLAVLFGYAPRFVAAMCKFPLRYYRSFTIPKQNGKFRQIDAPRVALKVIQKWFGFHLSKALAFHSSVYGFVPGRSAVAAAAQHCGANWVFSVDIRDFFPSTRQEKVAEKLVRLGYSPKGATVASEIACIRGGLAQGSPCSPVLSNLCFDDCDVQLAAYAQEHHITYTRYADDITFSGKGEPPADVAGFTIDVVQKGGWAIAEDKTHLVSLPKRLKVYGLLVHGVTPRLTKGYRNRLRRIAYCVEHGFFDPCSGAAMEAQGHLAYERSVNLLAARSL